MTRLRRALSFAADLAPLLAGAIAGAGGIVYALDQDWIPALWAALAAVLAFALSSHNCPPPPEPEPVERGLQCLHFVGGPEDGGQVIAPGASRDMHRAVVVLEGAEYSVGEPTNTCFRADFMRLDQSAGGGDR